MTDPASAAFSGRARFAPREDADDAAGPRPLDDEDIIGGLFGIEYCDCKGEVSRRDIVVHGVAWRGAKLHVGAMCRLRGTYRNFVAQNISILAHGRTGEIIEDPVAFFAALAGPQPEADGPAPRKAQRKPPREDREDYFADPKPLTIAHMRKELRDLVRPAAVLLMAMAKADQVLKPEEVAVIADLVFEGALKTYTYKETAMLVAMVDELTALQPTSALITRALNLTLDRGAFPEDLPAWLSRMARADGQVVEAENAAYRQILTTLRRLAKERETQAGNR